MPRLTDEQLQRLANSDSGDLKEPGKRKASDAKIEKKVDNAARKSTQTHTFRNVLFVSIVSAMGLTIAGSIAVILLYMKSEWEDIDAVVMVGWFSAVVVNTLGLAYIVAKYLFPEGGADSDD